MAVTSEIEGGRALRSRLRRGAISIFVAAYLVVQFVVPALRLSGPDDHPFAWQMYSTLGSEQFEAHFADGSLEEIDPADHVVRVRTEINLGDELPPFLCDRMPGLESVKVTSPSAGTEEFHRCSR
jgi:hypothetical protein